MIRKAKGRDPTMKRSQLKAKESDDKLYQQFKNLEQDWDNYKKSNPSTLRRSSTHTYSTLGTLQHMNNSPRHLMSSLQHRSSEGGWKVRINDLAVEEIRRERSAAIESGKLKGRRLFEGSEGETEVGFEGREEICSGWPDMIQESEVSSVSSYASDDHHDNENGGCKERVVEPVCSHCCSSSPLSSENVGKASLVVQGEMVKASVEERTYAGAVGGCSRGRWRVFMGWLAILLVVFSLGIISGRSFDGYGGQDEVILVPT